MSLDSMTGPFCAFLASCTWALGSTTYSRLSQKYPAYTINFSRAMVALPLFLIMALVTGQWIEFQNVSTMQLSWFFISVISSYALGDVLFYWATHHIGVPAALAIASVYPVWSALAGWLWRNESLRSHQWFGLVVVVTGVMLVISSSKRQQPPSGQKQKKIALGVVFAQCASLLWAMNTFATARGGEGLPVAIGNSLRMIMAMIFCPLIGIFLVRGKPEIPKSPVMKGSEFKKVFWIFAVEGFGGSFSYMYGLTHSSLAVASTLSSLAPVITIPITVMKGLEKFSLMKAMGVIMVAVGISLLLSSGH